MVKEKNIMELEKYHLKENIYMIKEMVKEKNIMKLEKYHLKENI